MTDKGIRFGSRRLSTTAVLLALFGLAIAAALLTPEVENGPDNLSSYSTSVGGARITYELAQRMGWRTSRREKQLDSIPISPPNVQVVIGPQGALGAVEVHRLLENVRRGGGLIFDVDGADEIADSLGLILRGRERMLGIGRAEQCGRSTFAERQARTLPPTMTEMAWRRPAPGPVTSLYDVSYVGRDMDVAIGFPLGAGRIAAVSTGDLFANAAVRVCEWGADIAVARSLEYVRPYASHQGEPYASHQGMPAGASSPTLVFDEYHHGYGLHGGSLSAISMFLSRTASGHFLAQGLIAALILLLAAAPRPIVPSDPERIVRRSPLEHADALGHAYSDVGATRTATSRLVSGLRRRAGRTVAVEPTASDAAFLDAVAQRTPSLTERVALVRRALDHTVQPREFIAVGEAIDGIEHALLTSPPAR